MTPSSSIHIIQYVPYFPPHLGGLETHAAQRAKRWNKKGYGTSIVATYGVGQPDTLSYTHEDGYTVVVIPAFEVIPTYPFPKFWTRQYREAHTLLKSYDTDIIITRTRFFRSSLMGGIYARLWGKKRVHIDHGVDYVKLNAKRKEWIARTYDQTIGRLVFNRSDHVIGISQGCKRFAQKFTNKDIPVIYRGVEFSPQSHQGSTGDTIALLFVGRLSKLKGIDVILQACRLLLNQSVTNRTLDIVGSGEELDSLQTLNNSLGLVEYVNFAGYHGKTALETTRYPHADICLNASYQEGLPMSVVEPLITGCVVVATAVGGTPEITDKEDLILVQPGDSNALATGILQAMQTYTQHKGVSSTQAQQQFDRNKNIQLYNTYFHSTLLDE